MHRETLKETKRKEEEATQNRDEKQRKKHIRLGGHLSIPLQFSTFE